MGRIQSKSYGDSYLYAVGNYEKEIVDYFIKAKEIGKDTKIYEDMVYEVKRSQNSEALLKTLMSDNVVLLTHVKAQPRAFKVFAAKDTRKGDKKMRVFIDCTDLIKEVGGSPTFDLSKVSNLIAYLLSALAHLIYYADATRIVTNASLLNNGTEAFAKLFTNTIDQLRIGGVDKVREKCLYMGALYYQTAILNQDFSDSILNRAKKISRLSDKDIELVDILCVSDTYKSLKPFIESVSKVIKSEGLKLDNFIGKWTWIYGSGTQFAVELFPAFSTMLSNTYSGAYLNNQKMIEKIAGAPMVDYTTGLLRLGSELQ